MVDLKKDISEYLDKRQGFLIIVGIALVVGSFLKSFAILIFLIAILLYFVAKRKGWITQKKDEEEYHE